MAKQAAKNHSSRWLLSNLALLACVVMTAMSVIETTHLCRQRYALLQELQSREWGMQENWSRLLLEESTWAAHHRVEKISREKLAMRVPSTTDTRVVVR